MKLIHDPWYHAQYQYLLLKGESASVLEINRYGPHMLAIIHIGTVPMPLPLPLVWSIRCTLSRRQMTMPVLLDWSYMVLVWTVASGDREVVEAVMVMR